MKFTLHKAIQPITIAVSIIFILLSASSAQVSVAPANLPCFQFLDSNGNPLAGGRVFSYLAGTTTLENTYIDSGGVQQNTDPIILNSGGFACIWLANKSYKFIVQTSAGSTLRTMDNVTGYLGLLNLSNTWTFAQTFNQAITITPSDNQIVFGSPGSQTIFDVPPSSGSTNLHFQTQVDDTVVNRTSTDTLTNKTLITPAINGGTQTSPSISSPTINGAEIVNSPGTYIILNNDTVTGTILRRLIKLTSSSPSRAVVTGSDTSGALGIVVSGDGTSGNVLIQQSGSAFCQFDGATTGGDYVQIGSNGQCHDAGAIKPTSGQIIGRVLTTNASGGTYEINLYPPEDVGVPVTYPRVIFSTPFGSTLLTDDSGATMVTASADTTYRFSASIHQSAAGTSCSGNTTINLFLTFTDSLAGSSVNLAMPYSNASATVASSASIAIASGGNGAAGDYKGYVLPATIRVKSGTTVTATSTYTLGASCSGHPKYEVVPTLEQMAAN